MSQLPRALWLTTTAIVICIALATSAGGCSTNLRSDPLQSMWTYGSGPMRTERRPLSGPVRTIVASTLHLRVVTAQTPFLELRCPSDVLPLIETTVDDGTLCIRLRSGIISTNGEMSVTVGLPGLDGLYLDGACTAEVDGMSGDDAEIELSGASSATVSGSAGQVRVSCSGASHADLGQMAAELWEVDCSGASSCTLAGTAQEVDLTATGASTIAASALDPARARTSAHGASRITLGQVGVLEQDTSGASEITALGSQAEAP